MRVFVPSMASKIECDSFYRGWTFLEAYYKAFQQWPDEALVRQITSHHADGTARQIADDTWALEHCVADEFRFCLVWKSSQSCVVHNSAISEKGHRIIDTSEWKS
jgi:hypothetical protein